MKTFFRTLILMILSVGIGFGISNFIKIGEPVKAEDNATPDKTVIQMMIMNKFLKVGKLITYEDKLTLIKKLSHKGFLSSNECDLEIKYKFGLGIDFEKVNITDINITKKIITFKIPREEIYIYSLQYLAQDTKVTSTKEWLAKEFTPTQVTQVYAEAEKEAFKKIANTPAIFDIAYEYTKNSIEEKLKDTKLNGISLQELGFKAEFIN